MRVHNIQPNIAITGSEKVNKNTGTGFADLLKQAVQEVNNSQINADVIAEKFAIGEIDNIHQVTIATEQAKLAMDLTLAIRNKVVDAYKEIMRLQF
ncbi:MAG: flagellar hook-basal body complex protein FliE [Halanaerobiales bacterium]|nr:flagellar hook-basal body complex protein FliE [Halanaerobiales bacterium]